jgi:hypothetical protein
VGWAGSSARATRSSIAEVAIKILPDALAHGADRLARFTREAKTLASLNLCRRLTLQMSAILAIIAAPDASAFGRRRVGGTLFMGKLWDVYGQAAVEGRV